MDINKSFYQDESYSFNYPIMSGVVAVSFFSDSTVGETFTKFFQKEFRYSFDLGLNWSDRLPLSGPNLLSVIVTEKQDLLFELTYTRIGSDPNGHIDLVSFSLTTALQPLPSDFWDNSIFKELLGDQTNTQVLEWSANVTRKMIQKGYIVPDYILRDRNEQGEDFDYINFWRALTRVFAAITILGRQFEDFFENPLLLREFLEQRGLFVCPDQSLEDMYYLMSNFWDEIRQRGTFMIGEKKGEVINGIEKKVDGELLRLICFNHLCDEFLMNFSEMSRIGWTVDQWSGLWMGIGDQRQLAKLWESDKTPDFISITNYPTYDFSGSLNIVTDGTRQVLEIANVPSLSFAGIASLPNTDPDFNFSTHVNEFLQYELNFWVKLDAGVKLTVGLYAYNEINSLVDLQSTETSSFLIKSDFLTRISLPIDSNYYFVRCILFPSNQAFNSGQEFTTTSINVGNNLRMTSGICKIIPYIIVDNDTGSPMGSAYLWDVRFQLSRTEYSTGLIEGKNFFQTWLKYNTGKYTDSQVEEIIKYYFIEFESFLKVNFLS